MEPMLIHLIKSTVVALLFLGSYLIFLRKETFYASNRFYLVAGIVVSIILPFFQLTKTVQVESQPLVYSNFSTIGSASASLEVVRFDWFLLIAVVYLLGLFYFAHRLVSQLQSIKALKLDSEIIIEDDIQHIRSKKQLSPFSFFKSIFYCPSQFDQKELDAIITHEKVHVMQHHSLDVLFIQLVCVLFWFNPILWIYKYYIKQNLEFLADGVALKQVADKKQYQYLMLSQTIGPEKLAITNPFNNSLIKKRIVMLHQTRSKKMNTLKLLLIIPVLVLFMMAFNTKTVYEPLQTEVTRSHWNEGKSMELLINKNTSDEELKQMKEDLAKEDIDFSYTAVRNNSREIIDISLEIKGKSKNGVQFNSKYNSNSEEPIDSVLIYIDDKNNLISFGPAKRKHIEIHEDSDHVKVWSSMDGIGEHQDIKIIKQNGTKKVIVNGKELTEDEMGDMDIEIHKDGDFHWESGKGKKQVKVKKMKKGNNKDVFIIKDADDDAEIEVISGDSNGFFFIDHDGQGDPLYIIDGKEATANQVKKLDSDDIATIDVRKGDGATKKYGKKAKNGVVEISTKKKN